MSDVFGSSRLGVRSRIEGTDVLGVLDLSARLQGLSHVEEVGAEEEETERDVHSRWSAQRSDDDRDREKREEEGEVALKRWSVRLEVCALVAPARVHDCRCADERHCECREEERRADDRSHGDVLRTLRALDDRDDRDQRLGHRGADRGQDRADRTLPHVQPAAQPLHRVREDERARKDDRERDEEEDDCAHRLYLPESPAVRRRKRRGPAPCIRTGAGSPRTSSTRPPALCSWLSGPR